MEEEKLVIVMVHKGGPLTIDGKFKFIDEDGKEEIREGHTAFCRCGQSRHEPFCDGTHAKVGFDK